MNNQIIEQNKNKPVGRPSKFSKKNYKKNYGAISTRQKH